MKLLSSREAEKCSSTAQYASKREATCGGGKEFSADREEIVLEKKVKKSWCNRAETAEKLLIELPHRRRRFVGIHNIKVGSKKAMVTHKK